MAIWQNTGSNKHKAMKCIQVRLSTTDKRLFRFRQHKSLNASVWKICFHRERKISSIATSLKNPADKQTATPPHPAHPPSLYLMYLFDFCVPTSLLTWSDTHKKRMVPPNVSQEFSLELSPDLKNVIHTKLPKSAVTLSSCLIRKNCRKVSALDWPSYDLIKSASLNSPVV